MRGRHRSVFPILGLGVCSLLAAGAARAEVELRPLSEAELRQRLADACVVRAPEGTECFSADGRRSVQRRAMMYSRYWVRGSELCVGETRQAPDLCRQIVVDAEGALYVRRDSGSPAQRFVLTPQAR